MCVYSRQHVYMYIYIYTYTFTIFAYLIVCAIIFYTILSYAMSQSIIVIGVYLVQARIALRIIIVMV